MLRIGQCFHTPWVVAVVSLAGALSPVAAAPDSTPVRPGLPERLAFRLEDGRHQTAGLSLSFGLPGRIEYECRRLKFRQQRTDNEIEIAILGVVDLEGEDARLCHTVKEPPPKQERVLLPAALGSYRIMFIDGVHRDSYTLAVAADTITLKPTQPPAFTTSEQEGTLARVDTHWLWMDLSFLTKDSFQKMRPKRDELLRALESVGAKPFVPPPGRYLMDGFVRQIPAGPPINGAVDEEHFFLWDGDWGDLQELARRYEKWANVDPRHVKRPVMTVWLNSRDSVVSSAGWF